MNLSSVIPYFDTLFMVMLGVFALASAVLSGMTIFNAMRLRNVKLAWKAGRLKGYPLFATLFLFFIVSLGVAVYRLEAEEAFLQLIAYSWIGVNWFVVSYLTSRRYITNNGIVKNINDPSQTIAWHQISDFAEYQEEDRVHYTFIYMEDRAYSNSNCCSECVRLELEVPENQVPAFRKIITQKLGRRFNCCFTEQTGIEQFKLL